MIRDTTKLEKHLERNPTDAQCVIALLKIKSNNTHYAVQLKTKKMQERLRAMETGNNASKKSI